MSCVSAEPEGDGLYVTRHGTGSHHVVFLHGWAASSRYWLPCAARLAELGCSCWLVDLPGFGRSAPLPLDDEVDALAELAAAVTGFLDRHGLDAVTLVGHSMGGAVSTHVAAGTPRVANLVLEDSTPEPPGGVSRRERIAALRAGGLTRELMEQGMTYWYRSLTPDQRDELYDEGRLADLDTLIRTQQALLRPLPERVVERLSMPVLVAHGREDPQRGLDAAQRLRARLPDARLAVLDGVGHTPHYENPPAFAGVLREFLVATASLT